MLGNPADVKQKEAIAALQAALKSGNEEEVKQAWNNFHDSLVASVKADAEMSGGDDKILAARGYRQLTGAEKKFYQNLIKAGKDANPKQAFTDLLAVEDAMPETIIEDVFRDLTDKHPLLAKINFHNVKYLTRWILHDHTVQTAAWGPINSEIEKEITSGFKEVSLTLCKLTAWCMIPKDMLDLGPAYLDKYIRTILADALYVSLEQGIISGNGINCPVGLDRNIAKDANFNQETGWAEKEAVALTSFLPEEYGPVLAKLAVAESGRMRTFDEVTLVCNQVDYLTKVMPATTVLNNAGQYAKNIFPFPTEVVRSNEVATGKAILFLPEEYFCGLGTSKDGVIDFSDEFKFLADARTYKIKLHGTGRPFDNTVALVLDISNLDPAYITVLNKDATPAA